jgi:uncharacterized protein (DUF1501 family)
MKTRREFLKLSARGSLLCSLAPSVPWLLLRSTARGAESRREDRVLVVLQLSGGNDGLNSVIPFQDDAYARLRPTLRLKPAELHKLNSELGFHPRMGALHRLFQQGQLAVVQGVGCPDQSLDHERAMLAWQTATPATDGVDTGWLGRATDHLWKNSQPAAPGVYVGNIPQPFGINSATAVVPSIQGGREARLFGGGIPGADPDEKQPSLVAGDNSLLRHVTIAMAEGRRSKFRMGALSGSVPARATYPAFSLAQDLRTVANLIRAEVGIRIFYVELGGGGIGGFDNHANQIGNHCALLEQLSESVAAFAADLSQDRLFDRVLLMTFSEFGRTAAENGRRGTDHGVAGPIFLAGGKLRGGIHGAHPSLTDLDAGALKHHTDFRAVYAAMLEDWLQIPSQPILGGKFPSLKLV